MSVEGLISPIRDALTNVIEKIDELVEGISDLISVDILSFFEADVEGEREWFADAVVDELDAHYAIIDQSKDLLISQVKGYEEQVRGVA